MKKSFSLFITIFIVINSVLSQTNDFKIGIFGFDYTDSVDNSCGNINFKPITTILNSNGYPSSQGNVLSSDGFNIVVNYQPDMYHSATVFMSGLLDLLKRNNLQFMVNERYFYKPNSDCTQGVPIYNNNGVDTNSNCKARPDYNQLYTSVYSNTKYSSVVWGHQITEEASYNHSFNQTDGFRNFDDTQNCSTEVSPSNVSTAIGYFRQRKNSLNISGQKLVVMEAVHGRAMWEGATEDSWLNSPNNFAFNDYLKMTNVTNPNLPDVFFEGSYFQFPETDWENQVYSNMFTNNYNLNYHYLGGLKTIDWSYTHVNEVHDVIGLETTSRDPNYGLHHYHSNSLIPNANWLWFQAYTAIIHGVKGIWFWDLGGAWEANQKPLDLNTRADRFQLNNFPPLYQNFIRHLSRELRYLVNRNLLSTNPNTVVCSKTDQSDIYGIVPTITNYINSSHLSATDLSKLKTEHKTTENYGLRYTIRTNGTESVMIISNPLNVAITNITLDFKNVTDPIIRNATSCQLLFTNNQDVNNTSYKQDRSGVDLVTNTLSKTYSFPNFQGTLTLSFGPMDVNIVRFNAHTGWNENILVPTSSNQVMAGTDLKYGGNGQIFYSRASDGIIHTIYKNPGGIWTEDWLNSTAPKMNSGSTESKGIDVNPANNDVFYVSYDKKINRLYWNGASWSYQQLNTTARANLNSELHYGNNQLFYFDDTSGKINLLSKSGTIWNNYSTNNSPNVTIGSGFEVIPSLNNTIYYIGTSSGYNYIYEITYNGTTWVTSSTNTNAKVRSDSEVHYGNGQVFYVDNNGNLSQMSKSGSIWNYSWLNGSAPKVKAGTGFAVVPEQNNNVYYIDVDNNIRMFTWSSSTGWSSVKINNGDAYISGGKQNHDLIFGDNQIFYVGINDTRIHGFYNVNTLKSANISNLTASSDTDGLNKNNLEQVERMNKGVLNNIKVFPNPAHNNFNIILPVDILYSIELIDINGKILKSLKSENQVNVDCSGLNPGIYLLQISSSGKIYRQKLVINK